MAINTYFTPKLYNDLFPIRNKFYSYSAFLQAIKELSQVKILVERRDIWMYKITRTYLKTNQLTVVRQDEGWNEPWAQQKKYTSFTVDFSKFCSEKNLETNKKELAAFLAQCAHETRNGVDGKYNDGLMFLHELNTSQAYINPNNVYPAVAGKKYYGRGPLQLSYNGNYGFASDCIFGDKNKLLQNPDLVTADAVTAFKTAIYFWMMPQNAKPSAHDVMTGNWQPNDADKTAGRVAGFGMTTNLINGEIECNKGNNVFDMNDRSGFYQSFLKKMQVSDLNCACSCGKMQPYP
ncbi:MAG: chitinase [Janthinobacterium lividum]